MIDKEIRLCGNCWTPSRRLKRLTTIWKQTVFTNGRQARSALTGCLRRSQPVRGWNRRGYGKINV